ncbi:WXG100 family type VII secretion target [Solihabitans fulvus]|uniref:WXG100 family type VII secretion target n=1 Tax=Solihabitans fulvus TaxID=1892852 RepID=UPI001CB768A6|nr:hypothetical protein [Solihabitans fulvus]
MAEGGNPLVATTESSSDTLVGLGDFSKDSGEAAVSATGGSGILNDAAATFKDASNGDWANLAGDVVTDGLDLLGAAMNPLDTLASAGVGWLIEHISFLKDGLDKLAGNPDAVTAKAVTWSNISKQLEKSATSYEQSAGNLAGSYRGAAADGYQQAAKDYAATLRGASTHAQSASTAMNVGAALVGTERGLIRDLISSFVGGLIVKALAALASSWCSFGASIAAFITDTVMEGASLAEKIATKIDKVVGKLGKLAQAAGKSKGIIEAAANALKKVGKGFSKLADKGLETAVKTSEKAKTLKAAGARTREELENAAKAEGHVRTAAEQKAEEWKKSWSSHTAPESLEGAAAKASEDGRSFLKPDSWQQAVDHTRRDGWEFQRPQWNSADTIGVAAEGRRQENEQFDRWESANKSYEQARPEGESAPRGEQVEDTNAGSEQYSWPAE